MQTLTTSLGRTTRTRLVRRHNRIGYRIEDLIADVPVTATSR